MGSYTGVTYPNLQRPIAPCRSRLTGSGANLADTVCRIADIRHTTILLWKPTVPTPCLFEPKHSNSRRPALAMPPAQEGYENPPLTPPLARRTVPGLLKGTATVADGDGGDKSWLGLRPAKGDSSRYRLSSSRNRMDLIGLSCLGHLYSNRAIPTVIHGWK
jgi:hypothetical protein